MEVLSTPALFAVLLVVAFAGVVHGSAGLGFPMIVTPVLALLTDVQTAILLTLVPNIAINLWSTVHGGNLGESVGRFWILVVWMLLGSAVGTWLLVSLEPNPFRLLLALVIIFYLVNEQRSFFTWNWIRQYPRSSGAGTGIAAGLLGGTVNVSGPLTLLYLKELRVSPMVLVQTLNLSFLAGKTTQTLAFVILGLFHSTLLWWSIPLGGVALLGLKLGLWIRSRISPERFMRWLRILLWILAGTLIFQFLKNY